MIDIYGNEVNPDGINIDIKSLLNKVQANEEPLKLMQSNLDDFTPVVAKKYTQNWPAYDKAKTNEVIIFKQLLRELLFLAVEEDLPTRGRKAYSTRDQLFCICIKVFCKSSLRTAQSMLKEVKQLNYIEKVPCFKSIDNFFSNKRLSKILDDLLLITFLPVSELEETGAIDSTGFSLRMYEQWSSFKYGKTKTKEEKAVTKGRIWRKVHAACGTKTNIFFSVKPKLQNTADPSMFEEVIGNKPLLFSMKNFTADKAYSSRRIVEFINNLGLNPYIPFKKHITGKARGSKVWADLFRQFKKNHDYYMRKYHQRSNIESSFHMVKMRFSSNIATRDYDANIIELKVKFLCHNLCCLIQEAFESDINIDFLACVKKIEMCKV